MAFLLFAVFFGWAGLHGYTIFDGWCRYGIDSVRIDKRLIVISWKFLLCLRKGCFWTDHAPRKSPVELVDLLDAFWDFFLVP